MFEHSRAAVFLNGRLDLADRTFYLASLREPNTRIIAADGALRFWSALREADPDAPLPELVVGDFDSLEPADRERWTREGVPFDSRYDGKTDKDLTDGQLALYAALDAECAEIDIHGAFPHPDARDHDHFLGNLALLAEAPPEIQIRLSEPREAVYLCRTTRTLERQGTGLNRVSLIPFGGEARAADSDGLRWRLQGYTLTVNRANALRNEFLPDAASAIIRLESASAPVLVFHNW